MGSVVWGAGFSDCRLPASGAIPPGETLTQEMPCWMAHPGLCQHRDSKFWSDEMDAAGVCLLNAALQGVFQAGDFLILEARLTDQSTIKKYYYTAYVRKSGPALVILCQCERGGLGGSKLQLASKQTEFDFCHHLAAIGTFYSDLANSHWWGRNMYDSSGSPNLGHSDPLPGLRSILDLGSALKH